MKRYIRSSDFNDLNEEERDYLEAKLVETIQNMLGEYDIDDIYAEGNRIGFAIYDAKGNQVTDQYVWTFRPSYDDGPEEQLDEWLDDFKYALPSKYKKKKR